MTDISALASATVAPLISPASRRIYALRLREFIASGLPLTREGVASHLIELRNRELSAASINQSRAAIRKLVDEARSRDMISQRDSEAIKSIRGDPTHGVKVGNWLSLEGVKGLLSLPNRETEHGARDAALFAVLIGCGLRRQEACDLTWNHYQQREERMCFVDLKGKGQRIRTVPVPGWAQIELDRWKARSEKGRSEYVSETADPDALEPALADCERAMGHELVCQKPVSRASRLSGRRQRGVGKGLIFEGLTPSGAWWIVKEYGEKMGVRIRPHDLRRTLARLMKKAGVDLEQIACTLGHSHLETTRIYLGGILELGRLKAGVDQIDWEGEKSA